LLVVTTSIVTGEKSHAVPEIHSVFNGLERANQKVEKARERVQNSDKRSEENYRSKLVKHPGSSRMDT
jgi:hypothetical protein